MAVGTDSGFRLFSINSTDAMDLVHQDGKPFHNNDQSSYFKNLFLPSDEPDVYIAERLFSSSLVAVVSNTNPRTLRVCHFKKGTEICRYSYNDKIRAVRMNRSVKYDILKII